MHKLKILPVIIVSLFMLHMVVAQDAPGGDDMYPALSPDGTKIAFTSNREGNNDIFVMNADGSDTRNLTRSPEDEYGTAWSPDSQEILFDKQPAGGKTDLFLMKADGSDVRNLTNSPTDDSAARWSPDGKSILFSSVRDGVSDVFLMERDGSGLRNITNGLGGASAYYYANWSPGGQHIAYLTQEASTQRMVLVVTNISGGISQRVLDHYWYANPTCCYMNWAWSPDGQQMAFYLPDDGNIYGFTLATSDLRSLAYTGGSINEIDWTPNGKRLLYAVGNKSYYQNSQGATGVYSVNLADGQIQPITPQKYTGFDASPDKSRLMIIYPQLGSGQVPEMIVYTLSDLTPHKIDVSFSNILGLAWSNDTRSIIASLCVDNDADLYRLDLDKNTATNLTPDDALTHPEGFVSQCRGFG